MHNAHTIRPARAYTSAPNTIIAGDVNLYYRDWGRGRPVLFVAGWSMCSDSWGYQMMALQRQDLRCIAFDRRGHGRSSDPGRGYDLDTLAELDAIPPGQGALASLAVRIGRGTRLIDNHILEPGRVVSGQ